MWMNSKQVSELTGYSTKTLSNWRSRRMGPPWVRPPGSGLVRYRSADIEAWMASGAE